MDVVIDKAPARDVTTISFSDVVDNTYEGYTEGLLEDYPEPGSSTYAYVFHFTGDLTQAEHDAVVLRVTTTPAEETMRTNMQKAITSNNNFLAQTSPRTTQQIETQLVRMTRENTAMIKLWLGQLNDASGT